MTDEFTNLEKNLKEIADFVVNQLNQVLVEQGHEATGKLIREHEARIEKEIDKISIAGYAPFYAIVLDKGVKASNIPYRRNPPNRGGKSAYITALISWAKIKGMASLDKELRNIAFAIANTHAKEGMPTKASAQYSSTGKRAGWITDTFKEKNSIIDLFVRSFIDKDFDYIKHTIDTLFETSLN